MPQTAPHLQSPGWRRSFGTGVLSMASVIAIVVASRRISGAFDPIPPVIACLAASLLMLATLAAYCLLKPALASSPGHQRGSAASSRIARYLRDVALLGATLGAPLLLGISLLTVPSSTAYGYLGGLLLAACLPALLAEDLRPQSAAQEAAFLELEPSVGEALAASRVPTINTPPAAILAEPSPPTAGDDMAAPIVSHPPGSNLLLSAVEDEACEDSEDAASDDHLSQWLSRSALPEGRECIDGGARVRFQAGQKSACVHFAFVPPLNAPPAMTCEIVDCDSPSVRAKVAYAQPFGARIELRRTDATQPASVVLGFLAESPANLARAA